MNMYQKRTQYFIMAVSMDEAMFQYVFSDNKHEVQATTISPIHVSSQTEASVNDHSYFLRSEVPIWLFDSWGTLRVVN